MEMHQVRYFLAVSRILNFTRAAEECHVAQPSLTRAIKQLEEELGGDLFRRERNLSHLTEFGQRMLPFLQQCYDSAHSAKQLAQSLKTGKVQPLSIAMSHAVNITVIIDHLTELTRAFSGLEIRFLRGTANEIGEILKKGEADVAIAGALGEDWGRLDTWPLFTEKMHLAVNIEHPLASTPAFNLTKLTKERLITRTYCENFANFENMLKERQVTPTPGHQTCSEQDLIAMLEANLGVGLLPESAPKSVKIKLLPLEGIDFSRTVYCYGVAGRQRSAAAATLIKMLRAADWTQMAA
jgi:DNA-binding transcriptional LysR family regulator